MKASTERKIIRWIHILLSIPVIGFIYGPVATIPEAAMLVRFVFFPIIVMSGFYLWKGHLLKNCGAIRSK
jgi:pyridoxal biosynthesis lyase PdxS